ncbi:MAG: Gp37 family protein [Zoogloeaceae bacterium]|jgi:hypothetical protein|nr:Gp37 family protein [Zoogloeaceae bacterium]
MNPPLIDSLLFRIKTAFPDMAVEFFPEKPGDYRLNHPKGALLLAYQGARFSEPLDTTAVIQSATARFFVTVALRQLNGRNGAVAVLPRLRAALVGFKPPDCRRKVWLVEESYLGELAGIWQYHLAFAVEAVVVEVDETEDGAGLSRVNFTEEENP